MQIKKLENNIGLKIFIIDIGFTFKQIKLNDKDLLLEYENVENYQNNNDILLNSFVGPFAGRIESGEFPYKNNKIRLDKNINGNYIHGGFEKWSSLKFDLYKKSNYKLIGIAKQKNVKSNLTYKIKITLSLSKNKNNFSIKYKIYSNRIGVCNPTHHFYWLRNEHKSLWSDNIGLNLDYIVYIDNNSLPVKKNYINLKKICTLKNIKDKISKEQINLANNGLDHPIKLKNNKLIFKSSKIKRDIIFKSTIKKLVIYTQNYPSTNNFKNTKEIKHNSICFEFQNHPISKKYNSHIKKVIIKKWKKYNEKIKIKII